MYRLYPVGIIDVHSRYIVGRGLSRKQTPDVVKGAIGQRGTGRSSRTTVAS